MTTSTDSRTSDPATLVRRSFDAYRDRDRSAIERLIAADFRFTSPYDNAVDRTTYFRRCWPNAERIKTFTLEHVVPDGDDAVFVTYLARTVEGIEFRNTEYHRCRGDQIVSVDVYFGASYRDGRFVPQRTD
jgi:ketosteroid isomerase-like protein